MEGRLKSGEDGDKTFEINLEEREKCYFLQHRQTQIRLRPRRPGSVSGEIFAPHARNWHRNGQTE